MYDVQLAARLSERAASGEAQQEREARESEGSDVHRASESMGKGEMPPGTLLMSV